MEHFLDLKGRRMRLQKPCSIACFGKQHPGDCFLGGSLCWVKTSSSIAIWHCYLFFLWQDWRTPVPLPHPRYLEIGRQILHSLQRFVSPGFNSQGFQTFLHGSIVIPFRLDCCSSLRAGLSPSNLVPPLIPQQPKQRYRMVLSCLCLKPSNSSSLNLDWNPAL